MTTTIAIKNMSTAVTDSQLSTVVTALQTQVTRDWYPAWRTTANLIRLTKTQAVPAGAWPIYILDNSDVEGALGYHDETNGVPYGRVFVKTAQHYGYSWTVTLSHELLEMLGNPNINQTVFNQVSNTEGNIYFMEVGDPCEDDSMGYKINNVLVSDFAYPAWYDATQTRPGTRYDHTRHLTAPFQIGAGGYVSVFNVYGGSGWTTLTQHNVQVAEGTDKSGRSRPDR